MRVGEIVALKWEDIKMDYIVINKSEKYDRITKEYFIDKTKNKKDRVFPKTKEIEKLFNTVKYVEQINGFLCEWVFADKDGRIHLLLQYDQVKKQQQLKKLHYISI